MRALSKPNYNLTHEFDYALLKDMLKAYKNPRVKINQLLKTKKITRVKKGLYTQTDGNFSPFVLANMMYGPSYVSSDTALGYYSLIPERVHTVTSVTTGRNKHFDTPAGNFTFEHVPVHLYEPGIKRVELEDQRAFLMASPEKALIDRLWREKSLDTSQKMSDYLEFDMRFDFIGSTRINQTKLRILAKIYDSAVIWTLCDVFKKRMHR